MLLIFFFLSFSYNTLRILKDSLVVTAKSSGAEVIPFIKVWAMLPGAVLLTAIYGFFASRLSHAGVFYSMMSIFLGYFFLFFCLYPFRESFHLHGFANFLESVLPLGCKGFIAMIRYWLYSSFYVMSELWGSVLISVMFWGLTNQIIALDQAKRFYGVFGIGINSSGIFAGQASIFILKLDSLNLFSWTPTRWDQSFLMILLMPLLSGLVVLGLFALLQKNHPLENPQVHQTKKKSISLRESFLYLQRSSYLTSIALIVVCYNMIINLVEVLWKHEVRLLYPQPQDYSLYMNEVSSTIGLFATLSALIVSGNAIRRFGWTFTAMITPMILFVTSCLFFAVYFTPEQSPFLGFIASFFGSSPLGLLVLCGTLQNVLSRGAKYTVFDATKEMVFVPLENEEKTNGKAAIDGVCSRLGKSGGSVLYQSLLILFSSLSSSAPYVACTLILLLIVWSVSVRHLGKLFGEVSQKPVLVS